MNETIFEELKSALITEQRLLKRFYDFSLAYQDFEFDEMGLNIEEAQDEKNKALKILDKLIKQVNEKVDFDLEKSNCDILRNIINLIVKFNINESKKTVEFILIVEEDSFTLEEKN